MLEGAYPEGELLGVEVEGAEVAELQGARQIVIKHDIRMKVRVVDAGTFSSVHIFKALAVWFNAVPANVYLESYDTERQATRQWRSHPYTDCKVHRQTDRILCQ